eukprot:SAG31_NODE_1337_length_8738_cov_2.840954_2_plen_87_part_00
MPPIIDVAKWTWLYFLVRGEDFTYYEAKNFVLNLVPITTNTCVHGCTARPYHRHACMYHAMDGSVVGPADLILPSRAIRCETSETM